MDAYSNWSCYNMVWTECASFCYRFYFCHFKKPLVRYICFDKHRFGHTHLFCINYFTSRKLPYKLYLLIVLCIHLNLKPRATEVWFASFMWLQFLVNSILYILLIASKGFSENREILIEVGTTWGKQEDTYNN